MDAATGRAVAFEEIPAAVEEASAGLRLLGVSPGAVVALLGRNTPEYPLLVTGILAAGGAVTPVNPYFHPHEIAVQLARTGATLLVSDAALTEVAGAATRRTSVHRVATFDGSTELSELRGRPAERISSSGGEDGDALLAWSVGPGGLPAPAVHTHASLSAALLGLAEVAPWTEDDVVFSVISPYDLYGLVATLALSLRLGMTAVTAVRFDVTSFAETARRFGVTVSNVVPTIVRALADAPSEAGSFGPLRLLISGGAPLAPHVGRACAERLGVAVVQGYGLAEGAGATHVDATPDEARLESCGRPVAGLSTRVVGDEGRPVDEGRTGELWLRGEQVFRGYRGAEDKTARATTPGGWLRTGDLAREDASRRLTLVGRRKPVVKVRGFQVSPAEVEAELRTHRSVRDAAVFPEWDARSGEEFAVAQLVVRRAVEPAAIADWLARRVARHKKPARFEIVPELEPAARERFFPWAATS